MTKKPQITKCSVDELIDKWDKETIWDKLYWWVRYGLWNKISDIPFEIKMAHQRVKRGYSDYDCWGLYYFLSKVISRAVRDLQKQAHGYPPELAEKFSDEQAFEEWKIILGKIANTFELMLKIEKENLIQTTSKEYSEEWFKKWTEYGEKMGKTRRDFQYRPMTLKEIKEYEEGWELFRDYFRNLWD